MNTISLTARDLRDLLAPVLPFADGGNWLPVLNSVRLRGHGDYVTALATDRYKAAVKRAEIEAPDGFQALLPVSTVKSILSTFKPTRTHNADLTLTFGEDRVSVQTDALADGLFDASIGYALCPGEYPRVSALFFGSADAEPVPLENYFLNPHFLAVFAKAATSGDPMRVHVGKPEDGRDGVLFVSIGDDFRGLLMPARATSGDLLDEAWRRVLPEPKREEPKPAKAARGKRAAS